MLSLVALLLASGVLLTSTPQASGQDLPDVITLEQAVEIALQQNTQVRRAEQRTQLAGNDVQGRRMDFLPQLNVSMSGSQSYGRNFSLEEGTFIDETTEFMSMDASASVNVFNGFRDVASLRQAEHGLAASEQRRQRTQQDVVFQVLDRFISYAQQQALVDVQREELELRQSQLERTEALIRADERPPSERYQQEVAVAEAEQQLLEAERAVELGRTRLMQVLALEADGDYAFEAPAPSEEIGDALPSLETMITNALQQRTDLEAVRMDLEAAEQGIRIARSGYYPSISFSAGYGSNWSSAGRLPAPGEPDGSYAPSFWEQLDNRRSGSLRINLSYPLFDRLQTRRNVERAEVDLISARYDLEDLRREIGLEVRQAYYDWESAHKALEVTDKRLESAERAREAVQERYRLGAAPLMELTQAAAEYTRAASERVRARYDFLFQQKRLEYLQGRIARGDW